MSTSQSNVTDEPTTKPSREAAAEAAPAPEPVEPRQGHRVKLDLFHVVDLLDMGYGGGRSGS